jgi:sarcosine oxidase gamma subunit
MSVPMTHDVVPSSGPADRSEPIARGPLIPVHRRAGASVSVLNGWEVATRYPAEPASGANALVDLSHWPTYEVNGPGTADTLRTICGADVPVRGVVALGACDVYRLTDRRAIIFRGESPAASAANVTGGWSSIALIGTDAETILSKVTAVDLRREALPVGSCCQGPLFGVNTLFGRFDDRFELHICSDSAEFLWEVLMDAGTEFGLKPAGLEFKSRSDAGL